VLRRSSALLSRLAELAAALMFAVVFSIFMLKVVLRYAFAIDLAWADEVCAILFVWIIFWANSFLVRNDRQICFNLVVHALPLRAQRGAAVLRNLVVLGLFGAALPGAIGYIRFLWREHTPVLELRLDYIYACFGIFMLAVCVRAALGALGRSA
jgi:TRAP-type C4-dicarboxylate transport system permease small subunit